MTEVPTTTTTTTITKTTSIPTVNPPFLKITNGTMNNGNWTPMSIPDTIGPFSDPTTTTASSLSSSIWTTGLPVNVVTPIRLNTTAFHNVTDNHKNKTSGSFPYPKPTVISFMSPSGSPTAGIAANVTAAAAGDVSGGAAAQQQVQMSGVVALVVCVLAMIGVF